MRLLGRPACRRWGRGSSRLDETLAVRTLEELEAALTTDLKWRVQEMFVFEQTVTNARQHEQPALLRASLALVYAHWEGYVKTAGSSYLEYLSRKKLKLGELRAEVAAVALRSKIQRVAEEKTSESHSELVSLLWDGLDEDAQIPYTRATIRTQANLNFRLFESIMHSLGCDVSHHRGSELLIDERLLGSRNEIAHGRGEVVSLDEWLDVRRAVESILQDVRTVLSNAAATESFRRADSVT